MTFLTLGNYFQAVVSVPNYFLSNSEGDVPFHHITNDYSRANWDSLRGHLRDVP